MKNRLHISLDIINAKKISLIKFGFMSGFLLCAIFLARWQIVEAKKCDEMATERIRNVTIPSLRGSIYARDGSTLAYQERRFDIYVYLPELKRAESYNKQTRDEFISKVSNELKIDKTQLIENLDSGPLWIKIAEKLKVDQKDSIVQLKRDNAPGQPLEGMFVEYTSERIYPEDELASHILGFYAYNGAGDKEGRAGIEYSWENSLKAIEGYKQEQVDSVNNTIPIIDFKTIEEKRGIDIYLTLNLKLQRIIEQDLKDAVEKYQAQAGGVVLMDPKTGEILALANYPTFNPNDLNSIKTNDNFSNRSINVPYEFGSVGKVFTIAAALDKNVVTPDTLILPDGHHGCEYFIPKENPQCKSDPASCQVCTADKKSKGPMTVRKALSSSDNIALWQVSTRLGNENLYNYLVGFGMGRNTGVEVNESFGYLKDFEKWNAADPVVYSYGHGYQATLLQVTSGVSAIPNDGMIMQPTLVSKIQFSDGEEKIFEKEVKLQPITKETARITADIMYDTYLANIPESYNRDLKKYKIGMKSGTALIAYKDRLGYSSEINSTYVGFDMSDQKTFILGVWLHKPKVGKLSSQNARLLWIDIFRDIKDPLGVPKSN